MKITVERKHEENGNLVFKITCSEPHNAPFGDLEKKVMTMLEDYKHDVELIVPRDHKLSEEISTALHGIKDKTFSRVIRSLRFAIDNELKIKFSPICQEVYNWIYDKQDGDLKKWLQEFDPERVKYYFDNDATSESDYVEEDDE